LLLWKPEFKPLNEKITERDIWENKYPGITNNLTCLELNKYLRRV